MTAASWLRTRAAQTPDNLAAAMSAAVLTFDQDPVPDALAAGAMALYERVVHGGGGREDALPLLAADALFTHAFEAQAELDPDEFEVFAARWSERRLSDLLG